MRMKRRLAFVLAVVMLMSNTVTASATSSATTPQGDNLNVVQNEDGTYTIGPDDVVNEDDETSNEDLENPSGDEKQEPSGEDVITDGTGDDSNGDNPTNPGGENNDDTNPGGDGGDLDAPNGEGEDGDAPLNPEEGNETTTEELTTEELTTEEMIEVSGVLFSEGDAYRDSDEYVYLYVNGNTIYFASIGSAIDYIDEKVADGTFSDDWNYNIHLEDGGNFSVSGDDLVSYENARIYLNLYKDVAITSADGWLATANINIQGANNSSLEIEPGVSLQLLEGNCGERCEWNDFTIEFPTSGAGDLIVGDSSNNSYPYELALFWSIDIKNVKSMYCYDQFSYIKTKTSNGSLSLDSLTVDSPIPVYDQNIFFRVPITVGTVDLSGYLRVPDITITESMIATGMSCLGVFGDAKINNLTTTVFEGSDSNFCIELYDSYQGNSLLDKATLKLSGELNAGTRVYLERRQAGFDGYSWISGKPIGNKYDDVVATVTLSGDEAKDATLTNLDNYYIYMPDKDDWMWCLEMGETPNTNDGNTYNIIARETAIGLYVDPDGDGTADELYKFTSLSSVKDYIDARKRDTPKYLIRLNKEVTASPGDLDYSCDGVSENMAQKVTLDLSGHIINLKVETKSVSGNNVSVDHIIAVDEVRGYGSDSTMGKIVIPANTALCIYSREYSFNTGNDIFWDDVIIEANSGKTSDLEIESYGLDTIQLNNVIFKNTFDEVGLYGDVYIYTPNEFTINDELEVDNIPIEIRDEKGEIVNILYPRINLHGGKVTAKNLIFTYGQLSVQNLKVTDKALISNESELFVLPEGSAEFNIIEVLDCSWDIGYSARINLQQQVEKSGDAVSIVSGLGTFKVNGSIINEEGLIYPIYISKFFCTQDENWPVEFENNETIATVGANVGNNSFTISGQNLCTKKVGTEIKVYTLKLRVFYNDGNASAAYISLEDAVANMKTDFTPSGQTMPLRGAYTFQYYDNDMLTKDVTIPDFVTDLNLCTEEVNSRPVYDTDGEIKKDEDGYEIWENDGHYQYCLNLNGKSLKTSASVWMGQGLRLVSDVATAGKFTTTYEGMYDALQINEDSVLWTKGKGNTDDIELTIDKRRPVLDNVLVTATDGRVSFYVENSEEYPINASFNVFAFCIDNGCWNIEGDSNYIAANHLWIKEANEEKGTEAGKLDVSTITINNGDVDMWGHLEVSNLNLVNTTFRENYYVNVKNKLSLTKGSRLEVGNDFHAKDVETDTSQMMIAPGGRGSAYIENLLVKTAYAGETAGDWTLINNGQMAVRNLTMKAGTLDNSGLIEAIAVDVKDVNNNYNGQVICDTFTNNAGKMYLGDDSHMMINKTGTLNNVNVGDRYGSEGFALIGRSNTTGAKITFTGTFTKNGEEQQLLGFVTNEYESAKAFGNTKTVTLENGKEAEEYVWDWISLSDDNETPYDYEDDFDASYVVALGEDVTLFETKIKAFPVEDIRVLPWTVKPEGSEERVGNINNAVYQSGEILKITGEYIDVCAVPVNEETASENDIYLDSFTTWADTVAYIDSISNGSTKYVINIKHPLTVSGALTMPKNVKALFVQGASEQPIELKYTGDIKLSANTAFVNLKLAGTNSGITTNGKTLLLAHTQAELEAITGTKTTELIAIDGSNIKVKTKLSNLGSVTASFGSVLDVTGGIAAVSLNMNEGGSIKTDGAVAVTDMYINKGVLSVSGGNSTIKVTGDLTLDTKATLNAANGSTITVSGDVYSNDSTNSIKMAAPASGKTMLTISGRVRTADPLEDMVSITVSEVKDAEEKVIGYSVSENGIYPLMKNAIRVTIGSNGAEGFKNGTIIAEAEKVSPTWFAVESTSKDADYGNLAGKSGKNIICGVNGGKTVTLSAMVGNEEVIMNCFKTLQEAFDEIEKIASPEMRYKVKLTAADTALNADGKTVTDYTFPKKAAEILIYSDSDTKLTYSKNVAINSDVTFRNVTLNPTATGGEIKLTGYQLHLDGIDFELAKGIEFGISATSGKGAELVMTDCLASQTADKITISKLSNVDTVVLDNTVLVVTKDTKVGELSIKNDSEFIGLGKIEAVNLYAPENDACIVTAPKLTVDKTSGKVTKTEATMTVTGKIQGDVTVELSDGTVDGRLRLDRFVDGLTEVEGAGIAFVKATKASSETVSIYNTSEAGGPGYVYKKSGVFVYKEAGPQVELIYYAESEKVCAKYESFVDAVKEIESLKIKRDYEIVFTDSEKSSPVTLKMPKSGMVNTLTLTADGIEEVYYLGDITFDSNIVLKDINFAQVVAADKSYEAIDKVNAGCAPVKVKVNGAYTLEVDGSVTFNTPVALEGAKKATWNIASEDVLHAYALIDHDEELEGVYVEGTVKDFAAVNVSNASVCIDGYNPDAKTYSGTEFNVTELKSSDAVITVGRKNQTKDAVTITKLNLDGGSLVSEGKAALTEVVLSGNPEIEVYGQTFDIKGNLTLASRADITTVLNAKGESALSITGNVIQENRNCKAVVCVEGPKGDTGYYLGGSYQTEDPDDPEKLINHTYNNKLLTASKASISAFAAASECTDDRDEYDADDNTDGYILKKDKNDIRVYYGSEVEAALYLVDKEGEVSEEAYNYYLSFNEAVAEVDALKDVNAEYEIRLLNDVGSEKAPETVKMPAKASHVRIFSEVDNKGEVAEFHYNADIKINCNTTFESVGFAPAEVNKKLKGISANGYELIFDKITTNGLGKLDGAKAASKVVFKDIAKEIEIKDDIAKVGSLELAGSNIKVTGKADIGTMVYAGNGTLKTAGKTTIANVSVTAAGACEAKLQYADLSITGDITSKNASNYLDFVYTGTNTQAKYVIQNNKVEKLDLVAASKLAGITKAALTNVRFNVLGADGKPVTITNVQWSGGSVYHVADAKNTVDVYAANGTTLLAECVDLSQASAYIDAKADKNAGYVIGIASDLADTKVTDTTATAGFALPGKDKAASVVVDGKDDTKSTVAFTGDITANGIVELKDINLKGSADFGIKNVKNSDDRKAGTKGEAKLTLTNVSVTQTEGKGYVKGITGEKNTTVFTLDRTALLTTVKSDVYSLKLVSGGSWAALSDTTITEVDNSNQGEGSFLGTYLVSGVPKLTITGTVKQPVEMKLYHYNATTKVADLYKNAEYTANTPLVIAKTEAAEMFKASPYAGENNAGIVARKDAKNYVYNSNLAEMEVLLKSKVSEKTWEEMTDAEVSETYVKTYAEAISIINNTGNKDADYKILLRKTTTDASKGVVGNNGVIKTAGTNGVAAYGALALPQANKANSLIVSSEDKNNILTVKYTGTIKANCDLAFENVILTEGTADTTKEDGFAEANTITPELGNYTITFGNGVKTPVALTNADMEKTAEDAALYTLASGKYDLVFSKVTTGTKGGCLDISGHNAYVNGDAKASVLYASMDTALSVKGTATITNVEIASEEEITTNLACKGKIKLTNVWGGDTLNIRTAYTKNALDKAESQLEIAGETDPTVAVNIYQYVYDAEAKTYHAITDEEAKVLLYDGYEKPAKYKKIVTAPKLQVSDKIKYITGVEKISLVKYDKGIYLTDREPVIKVLGYDSYGADRNKAEYTGYFFDWNEAVKEIDQLNHAPSVNKKAPISGWEYDIILLEDIGAKSEPLMTFNLPAKAEKVTIMGEADDYYTYEDGTDILDDKGNPIPDIEGILITGSNVSLKTDLDIRVPVVSVKQTGNAYYSQAYTLNAGNYDLTLTEIPSGADFDEMGWYNPQIKLSGSATGTIEVMPGYDEYDVKNNTNYSEMIRQISGVGSVTLKLNEAAKYRADANGNYDPNADETTKIGYFDISDGISNVTTLTIEPGVIVGSLKKDVSVKNLVMGESVKPEVDEALEGLKIYKDDKYVKTYVPNELHSRIEAKNITVSNTLTMASSEIKAGTSAVGDGKVTLTNVVFADNHNLIEGKQDKSGKNQIQIKGTVSSSGENIFAREAATAIGVYYSNSSRRYVQLVEGMTLLAAPKAASSWFSPCYGDAENPYMGTWLEEYGVYKSGNDVKYGLMEDTMEVRVIIGEGENLPSMEFATFEEAVKAIDAMNLQIEEKDEKGRVKKVNESYVIELLDNVDIGNEKLDGKFKTLTLPAKASMVQIIGNGHVMKFSGNVTLKCSTIFTNVRLLPMKTVKGEAVPSTANFSIGNFAMAWINSYCDTNFEGFDDLSGCNTCIGNITGGAKGELMIGGTSKLKANNITGLNAIRFIGDEKAESSWYADEDSETYEAYNENCGQILATGNVTIKELHYQDKAAGILRVQGNFTTNVIYVTGECNAQIWRSDDKQMKVNGVTSYTVIDDETEYTVKGNESVVYHGFKDGDDLENSKINVKTVAKNAEFVSPGTKILSGKYLNAEDWNLQSFDTSGTYEGMYSVPCKGYMNGDSLYIGDVKALG